MAQIPNYQIQDILNGWLGLFPDGIAWQGARQSGSVLNSFLLALAQSHYTITQAGYDLPASVFPATTIAGIPEWQETLNLPDVLAPATTQAEIQSQIVSRLVSNGGASIPFFTNFVANLLNIPVSEVSILTYYPFLEGFSRPGYDSLAGVDAAFHWQISIPSAQSSYVSFVNAEVARLAPAQTVFDVVTH